MSGNGRALLLIVLLHELRVDLVARLIVWIALVVRRMHSKVGSLRRKVLTISVPHRTWEWEILHLDEWHLRSSWVRALVARATWLHVRPVRVRLVLKLRLDVCARSLVHRTEIRRRRELSLGRIAWTEARVSSTTSSALHESWSVSSLSERHVIVGSVAMR